MIFKAIISSRTYWLVAGLIICNSIAVDTSAQDNARFVRWMYQDAAGLVLQVNARTPLLIAGASASLAALSPADPRVLGGVQTGYRGGFANYLNTANRLGDPEIKYPVLSIFAVSLFTNNDRFQDASFTSTQSLLYASLITMTLKTAFGRARPESGYDEQAFSPFSGRTSFPSGHTTSAFAIVTPWVMYYPGPVTYSLFALSTGTAVARIARDKHWPTDVVAGAAIGFFTARFLSHRHQEERGLRSPRLRVSPEIGFASSGILFVYRIG
ncbi:MAG: phosphatase PAP2 family protein [Rhodothermales bacterium]|nr:phosphatase PAP2 family protein [Rhodothermales bacterium]